MRKRILLLVGWTLLWLAGQAQQTPTKTITSNTHFWTSVNSTFRFNNNWGMMADAHVRRTNFIADPSFYFARIGLVRWFQNQSSAAIGYGNLLSPSVVLPNQWNIEYRLYQQFQFTQKYGSVNLLQRFRNENRWRVAPESPKTAVFTNRIRYLLSATIPVFKNPAYPSLVIADEILMQWGKSIVYNPLDQNRIFVGIRQSLGKQWSYDAGYMYVFQQKSTGNQYDANHTLRLFFYYAFNQHAAATDGSE